jgi:TetR/AcrR family transcriptional repressor of nem operon
MARYARRREAACADIDAARGTGGARLKALVQLYRAALGDGTQLCLCVAFSISRDHLSADTLREVTQFRGITLQWLQTVFALGGSDGSIHAVQDTQIEAASTLALLEGAQLAARTQHDLGRFDMAVSLLEKRISS